MRGSGFRSVVACAWIAGVVPCTAALAQTTPAAPAASDSTVTPGNAAPEPNSGVPDIVVTATKMGETSLQRTPIAVSVLSGAQLADRGVRDIRDLKAYVPSLQVSDLSGYSQLYLRGVGSNIVYIGSDPSTTIHLDGVYLARPLSYLSDFLDVERIEVLRGPQGTLYGRNSVGGTINVISRRPSDTLTGQIQGQYGSYDRYGVQGYLSGPVAGRVDASLAFDVSGHDAFRKNVSTGNDLEDMQSRGVRGQVRVPIGTTGSWVIRADWSRQSGALGAYPKLIRPDGVPLDDSILGDPGKVSANDYNHSVLENYGAASDLTIGIADGITLHSLTGYRGFRGSIVSDADSSSLSILRNQLEPVRQHQISEELTLNGKTGKLDWVVGGYYFREHDKEPQTINIFPFSASYVQRPLLIAHSAAVFGQAEYHLTDQLSFLAGVRYTGERKRFDITDYYTASTSSDPNAAAAAPVLAGIPGLPDPFRVDAHRRDHAVTPKFGVNFTPTRDILVYASATRGFKSGGYDYGANNPADVAAGYGPETLWSYEAGIKSDWLDHRLRVNLTGFYYDYKDLQVESYVQVGGSFGARTQNAATARITGAEAEIVAKPIRPLQLFANLAYLDAHYRRYPGAYVQTFGTFDASGNRLNNAPRWSATFGADYSVPLDANGTIDLAVDAHVQSTVYFTAANDGVGAVRDYPEQQHAYGVIDARLGWTSADRKWKVQVIGTNLANRNYIVGTANYTAAISARQGRPREVLGQVGFSF